MITNRELDLIPDTVRALLESPATGAAPESPSPAQGYDAPDVIEHAAETAR